MCTYSLGASVEQIEKKLDHEGPVPLYRQIASRLQYEIVTGMRVPGERLVSIRDAAEAFGVNLHTVRRAYKELEAIGLVEMKRPTGTRVAPLSLTASTDHPSLDFFLAEIVREGDERFGLTVDELIGALERRRAETPTRGGCVVECSRTLSGMLADRLRDEIGLDLEPFDLRDRGPLPGGPVVGTWFHHSELVDRLHERKEDLHLLRIRPAESLLTELRRRMAEGRLWSVILLDRHPVSAHNLTIDFRARLGIDFPVEVRVPSGRGTGLPETAEGSVIIASPQTWDLLSPEQRRRSDVTLLEYEIYEEDLARVGRVLAVAGP